MDYSSKQKELDVQKWVDSEIKNCDTCGSYSYCSNCNKSDAYPCAYAYEKYAATIKISTPKTKKTTTKSIKTSTSTTKKTCAKKSTTKKTTKATAKA